MNRSLFEMLEPRQCLSISAPLAPITSDSVSIPAVRASVAAASPTVYGSYVGTIAVEGNVKGSVVVQVTRSGAKTLGRIYSAGFGGFNVVLAGTVSGKTFSLGGRTVTAVVKRVGGTLSSDGRTISGSVWMYQNGLEIKAPFKLARTATPPKPVDAKASSLLGGYRGYSIEDGKKHSVSISFTRQSGGLVWGKSGDGVSINGIVLADGRLFLLAHEKPGITEFTGKFLAGKITAQWHDGAYGPDDSGTLSLTRV